MATVCGCMRAMPELRAAVLSAYTGYGQDYDHKQSLSGGFDHHLIKPCDLARFCRISDATTGRSGQANRLRRDVLSDRRDSGLYTLVCGLPAELPPL